MTEHLSAVLTLGALTHVDAFVGLHVMTKAEGLAAKATGMLLLASMHNHMTFQLLTLLET